MQTCESHEPVSKHENVVRFAAHAVEGLHGLEALERRRGLESQHVEQRKQSVLPILVLQAMGVSRGVVSRGVV